MSSVSSSIKLKLGDDVRRIAIPNPLTLSSLSSVVRQLFEEKLPSSFAYKYHDDENDLISVASDADLAEAVHLHSSLGRVTTLLVVEAIGVAAAEVSTPAAPSIETPAAAAAAAAAAPATVQVHVHVHETPIAVESPASAPSAAEIPRCLTVEDFFARLLVDAGGFFKAQPVDLSAGVEELRGNARELVENMKSQAEQSLLLAQMASLLQSFGDSSRAAFENTKKDPIIANNVEMARTSLQRAFAALEQDPKTHELLAAVRHSFGCFEEPTVEISAPIPMSPPSTLYKPGDELNALFVRDVTLQDGCTVEPGTNPLVKVWHMTNSCAVSIPEGCSVVPRHMIKPDNSPAEPFGALVSKVDTAAPGEAFNVTLTLTCPTVPGRYKAFFRLQAPNGDIFGERLWLDVTVAAFEYQQQLDFVVGMGFTDIETIKAALVASDGNTVHAIEVLIASSA